MSETQKERHAKMHDITWLRSDKSHRLPLEEFTNEWLSNEFMEWYPGCKKKYRPVKFRWGIVEPDSHWNRGPFQAYFNEFGWQKISYKKACLRLTEEEFWEKKIEEFFRERSLKFQPEKTICYLKGPNCLGKEALYDGKKMHCHHNPPFKKLLEQVRQLITKEEFETFDWFRGDFLLDGNHPAVAYYDELELKNEKKWVCINCHYQLHDKKIIVKRENNLNIRFMEEL